MTITDAYGKEWTEDEIVVLAKQALWVYCPWHQVMPLDHAIELARETVSNPTLMVFPGEPSK